MVKNLRLRSPRATIALLGSAAVIAASAAGASGATSIKPYVEPIGGDYEIEPLFSVDDKVPLEGGTPGQQYRMVGIPDGLGAHPNGDGTTTLYMNHELPFEQLSEPVVGGVKNRGTIISRWTLDAAGNPLSGRRAYDTVWQENTLIGPAPAVGNATRSLSRFCSGFLAGRRHGFDRPIYLTGEEEQTAANSFDGLGSQSVAVLDNELHALPRMGRFAKENTVVQPGHGTRTVAFPTEDGPPTLDSQLYMYVGKKDHSKGASALSRNGLDTGSLYVFRSFDSARNSERTFRAGSVEGEWVEIPNAGSMSATQLEAEADAVGAMTFVRPEDAAFNPRNKHELFLNTTGSSSGADDGVNELGRLYSLQLHPGNVLKPARLTIVYNADTVVAQGGDIAISPDNLDASRRYLMINEDGTTESRAVMASKGRDGSIWRFELSGKDVPGVDVSTATRVAQLDPPGRDGVPVGPGVWETSGIIDTSRIFGADTWVSDVQAHPPTTAPGGPTVTVEDGQLFLMRPRD